jgi:NitT/TauT family transport system ATP-binding protein
MSDRVVLFSPSPGKVHKVFEMPDELRSLSPFNARNHETFSSIFQTIWKELESLESRKE